MKLTPSIEELTVDFLGGGFQMECIVDWSKVVGSTLSTLSVLAASLAEFHIQP